MSKWNKVARVLRLWLLVAGAAVSLVSSTVGLVQKLEPGAAPAPVMFVCEDKQERRVCMWTQTPPTQWVGVELPADEVGQLKPVALA